MYMKNLPQFECQIYIYFSPTINNRTKVRFFNIYVLGKSFMLDTNNCQMLSLKIRQLQII